MIIYIQFLVSYNSNVRFLTIVIKKNKNLYRSFSWLTDIKRTT